MPKQINRVAVLGAGGAMGFEIARNLARGGFEVQAWNRSREKAEPLADDGATICESPTDAAREVDLLLTMLADADAVLEAAGDALATADDNVIWLQMSTIGEQGTEQCIELAKERGVAFVDAPVLGSRQPAAERKLVILGSGPEELREPLAPLFEAISQRTMWIGEVGSSSRLKLAINAWIVTVVEGGAETLALAEGLGLDPRLVLEALSGGPLDLPYLQMKGKAMIERDFEPSFRLVLAAKDARLAQEAAERRDLDLPLLATIRHRLEEGIDAHGDEDMCVTYLTSLKNSEKADAS